MIFHTTVPLLPCGALLSHQGHQFVVFHSVPAYIKRVIAHPNFKNIDYATSVRLMADVDVGDVIIRPSSKVSANPCSLIGSLYLCPHCPAPGSITSVKLFACCFCTVGVGCHDAAIVIPRVRLRLLSVLERCVRPLVGDTVSTRTALS